MLASVLAVWRKLRDELQEKGAVQTAAQQRRSINRMVEKLAEVKTRMDASEAAHKVVHPGTELPVATMELVLDEFASKYSSMATVEGAYSLELMEAFGVVPEPHPYQPAAPTAAARTARRPEEHPLQVLEARIMLEEEQVPLEA